MKGIVRLGMSTVLKTLRKETSLVIYFKINPFDTKVYYSNVFKQGFLLKLQSRVCISLKPMGEPSLGQREEKTYSCIEDSYHKETTAEARKGGEGFY